MAGRLSDHVQDDLLQRVGPPVADRVTRPPSRLRIQRGGLDDMVRPGDLLAVQLKDVAGGYLRTNLSSLVRFG
jgi:hypothetical protein